MKFQFCLNNKDNSVSYLLRGSILKSEGFTGRAVANFQF